MSSSAIRAGRAFVELFADDSKLARGLKSAQKKVQAFAGGVRNIGLGMAGAGAAVLTPLVAAVAQFAKAGDEIQKMSGRTGIAVEELSSLGVSATRAGADLQTFEKGIKKMQANISDFRRNTGEASARLTDLGLTVADFDGKGASDQYKMIADRIAGIADPGERAAAAMDVFGASAGQKLVNHLAQGSAAIEEAQLRAERLGLVISDDMANNSAAFTDAWADMKDALQGVSNQVANALMPVLTEMLNAAVPLIATVIDWVKSNKQVIVTIAGVASAVAVAGAGLVALSGVITAAGAVIGGVTAVVSGLSAAMAFLVTPVGLVVAGIAATTAALAGLAVWAIHSSGILSGTGKLFHETFGGIISALGSGDLEAAGKTTMLGLKAIWTTIWNNMEQLAFDKMKSVVQGMKDWGLDKLLELGGIDADLALQGFDLLSGASAAEVDAINAELRALIADQKAKSGNGAAKTSPDDKFDKLFGDLEGAILEAGGGGDPFALGDLELNNALAADLVGARDNFAKGVDLAGTFSGSALSGLGPETLQRAALREAEKMNAKLDDIDRNIQKNKLQFLK